MKLAILFLLAACAYSQSLAQSTLTANLQAGDTTAYLSSAFPFTPLVSTPAMIFIDSEAIGVTSASSGSGPVLTSGSVVITRGQMGTTAVAHNAGSIVYGGWATQFVSSDKTGACTGVVQYLNVTDQTWFTCTGGTWIATPTRQWANPGLLYSAAGRALPGCNLSNKGRQQVVSDATTPTWMGAYVSGGLITVGVICSYDGTNYTWLTR